MGGMKSIVVFFKPRNHLFACTHPSVLNAFDWNDWSRLVLRFFVFPALCSKHVWIKSSVCYKHLTHSVDLGLCTPSVYSLLSQTRSSLVSYFRCETRKVSAFDN